MLAFFQNTEAGQSYLGQKNLSEVINIANDMGWSVRRHLDELELVDTNSESVLYLNYYQVQ